MIIFLVALFFLSLLITFISAYLLYGKKVTGPTRKWIGLVFTFSIPLWIVIAAVLKIKVPTVIEESRNREIALKSKVDASLDYANELGKYGECIATAEDDKGLENCKSMLSVGARARLEEDRNKNGIATGGFDQRIGEDEGENSAPMVLTADCKSAETSGEKLICSTPQLVELNSKLAALYAKTQSKDEEWSLRYREILSCKDDVECMKKYYNDQIYRVSHSAE